MARTAKGPAVGWPRDFPIIKLRLDGNCRREGVVVFKRVSPSTARRSYQSLIAAVGIESCGLGRRRIRHRHHLGSLVYFVGHSDARTNLSLALLQHLRDQRDVLSALRPGDGRNGPMRLRIPSPAPYGFALSLSACPCSRTKRRGGWCRSLRENRQAPS